MRALSVLLCAMTLAACGAADDGGHLPLGIDLQIQRFTGSEELQFVFLRNTDTSGAPIACSDVEANCIADQVGLRIVELRVDGANVKAYIVPIDISEARSADGQSISVPGIPPGRNYLLVVEAVRDDGAGRQRVGVGCTQVAQVVSGDNPPLSTAVDVAETASACGATID